MRIWNKVAFIGLAALSLAAVPAVALAAGPDGTQVSAGDTAWVLGSASLVMLMTPALAFFYGGMVRQKNALGTLMNSFVIIALISVQWVLWG